MRNLIFAIVFVSPPWLKKIMLRMFCKAKIHPRAKIAWLAAVVARRIEIGEYSEIKSFTMINCGEDIKIGKYTDISYFCLIYGSGSLIIGDHSYIAPQCHINTEENVRIGNVTAIGPRCMIFTHNAFLPYTEGYFIKYAPVNIGSYVWIGSGAFINPGITVGDNVFVVSMSIIKNNIPAGEVVEGLPAERINNTENIRRVMTPERVDAVAVQMLERFGESVLLREMDIPLKKEQDNLFSLSYRNRKYLLGCISSSGVTPVFDFKKRLIILVNRQNWVRAPEFKRAMVFNLVNMMVDESPDQIFRELCGFLRRYYGLKFEYSI